MAWTQSNVIELKRRWGEGTAAKAIGTGMGKSKNAVIGKAHRLNLEKHPYALGARVRKTPKPRKSRAKPKFHLRPVVRTAVDVVPLQIPFHESKAYECREITGRGLDGLPLFCGHPVALPHLSYCGRHFSINTQPARRR